MPDNRPIIGLIPARYRATRLPGKVLLNIAGKPMIQHVYERACQAAVLDEVIIATDDERILRVVQRFGGRAVMTRPDHASGTDRIAEVVRSLPCALVVNIQGDEPMIPPTAIDAAVQPLLDDPDVAMATLATDITTREEHHDPAAVKVVVDAQGWALYFSRAPIPFFRLDPGQAEPDHPRRHPRSGLLPLKHIGLYVYRRDTLLWFASLPPSPLEQTEGLEQLRALDAGCRIKVSRVDYSPVSVDTPADLERVRRLMEDHA